MNFAENLKQLRKSKKITQKELANDTGIALQSIINYELGRREPNSKAMAVLENYYNVSGAYLRGDEQELKWQNNEIKEAIEDNLSIAAESLINTTRKGTDQSMSMIFDILVELRHIMKLDQDKQSQIYSSLLQSILTETTIFMDVCNSSSIEQFSDRCNRSKEDVVARFTEHLNTFQTELLEQKKNSKK